jgi:hypothetical protein
MPGAAMSAADQAARDNDTRRHYALQLTSTGPRTVRTTGGGAPRKANQLCWLCEQRRACTKQQHGWECDACRSVT